MRSSRLVAGVLVLGALTLTTIAAADGTPMTKKQWRRTANSLCRKAAKAEDKLLASALPGVPDDQPSLEQITEYVNGLEPIFGELITDIDALIEPRALQKPVKKFVKTARRELERLVADPSIGLEGNPLTDTSLQAEELGLRACL